MIPDYVPPVTLLDHVWRDYKANAISREDAIARMREVYASTGTAITDAGTAELPDNDVTPSRREWSL